MGNVAVTVKRRTTRGNKRLIYFDLTMSSSYATNGDTIQDADIKLLLEQAAADLTKCDLFVAELGSGGHELYLDRTNKKVKAFNGTTEIANATNLSAVVVRCAVEFGAAPGDAV